MTENKLTKMHIEHRKNSFSQKVVVEQNFVGVKLLKNEEIDCVSRLNNTLSLRNLHKKHLVDYREILRKKVRKDRLEISEKFS